LIPRRIAYRGAVKALSMESNLGIASIQWVGNQTAGDKVRSSKGEEPRTGVKVPQITTE